jgi:hypothetical protein
MKKIILYLMFLLNIPLVFATECGLSNLATCIPEKFNEYFVNMLNAPIQPLLDFIRSLMETSPSIELFYSLWVIILYCISMFYGFLFLYAGLQFLVSGHDIVKREQAKQWLKNTVLMIVCIQASFYLYGLLLDLASVSTSAILSMINEEFFLLTIDSLINFGLELIFLTFYVLTLLFTILFLLIRYLIVCFGVVFIPIGIFCFFIPPLKSYGKLILNLVLLFIFIIFIDAILILGSSMLVNLAMFENFKIMIMISCFSLVNLSYIILIWHVISKSGAGEAGGKIAGAVKYIAML